MVFQFLAYSLECILQNSAVGDASVSSFEETIPLLSLHFFQVCRLEDLVVFLFAVGYHAKFNEVGHQKGPHLHFSRLSGWTPGYFTSSNGKQNPCSLKNQRLFFGEGTLAEAYFLIARLDY